MNQTRKKRANELVDDFDYVENINDEKDSCKNNLFVDALVSDINTTTLYNMLNEYAFLIDFQRDLHKGDQFIFVLETTRDNDGDFVGEKVLYSNLILSGRKHEIFNYNGNSVYKYWISILKNCNIPHKKFHCIRHTYGSLLLQNGVDIQSVAELMGHTAIGITQIYMHSTKELKSKEVNKLNNLLKS